MLRIPTNISLCRGVSKRRCATSYIDIEDEQVGCNTMADHLTPDQRSSNMRAIRSHDTRPEIVVRRLLHSKGYRFRKIYYSLPGKPDIVFPSRMKIILIHGCFWHRHPLCKKATTPKTNVQYWLAKFERNRQRDAEYKNILAELGWITFVVWECELKDLRKLSYELSNFLGPVRWGSDREPSSRVARS